MVPKNMIEGGHAWVHERPIAAIDLSQQVNSGAPVQPPPDRVTVCRRPGIQNTFGCLYRCEWVHVARRAIALLLPQCACQPCYGLCDPVLIDSAVKT